MTHTAKCLAASLACAIENRRDAILSGYTVEEVDRRTLEAEALDYLETGTKSCECPTLTKVSIEGDPENLVLLAKVSPRRWNGWAVPSFPVEQVNLFAAQQREFDVTEGWDTGVRLHWDKSTLVITSWDGYNPNADGLLGDEAVYITRVEADEDGLYLVDLGYVWYEVPEPEPVPVYDVTITGDDDKIGDLILHLRATGFGWAADSILDHA